MAGPASPRVVTGADVEPELAVLAAAHGVATSYVDAADSTVSVARDTVVRVLASLDVEAGTPAAVGAALAEIERKPWRRLVPATVVVRQGSPATVVVRGPAGSPPRLHVRLEDGGAVELPVPSTPADSRVIDREQFAAWHCQPPAGLPLGWHRLVATQGGRTENATFVVTPDRLSLPPALDRQAWGWMVQLYAVRSGGSWGMGDLADLAELARWSAAEQGAAALLCNPLHAVSPVPPIEPSPYYPSSRRFWNPLYLRVQEMAEYRNAEAGTRARVDALRPSPRGDRVDRVDRDTVWVAKLAAWELLWPSVARSPRAAELAAFRVERGRDLEIFGRFCALAERHGLPWQRWPAELRHPDGPAVGRAAAELADRVAFHTWLQLECEEQLAAVQAAAKAAGMAVGVLHDLAIGADPGGADAWALQGVLAENVTIGSPPDAFTAEGQSWGLPPWRPDRLAEMGYVPYRDLLRSVLRYAGGLRVDHVLGLFRLWWIPAGAPPSAGTYVRYDDEALLGVLALEAHRAGALVIGEDLGTVEPRVRTALAGRGVLSSAVLWFQHDNDGEPLPPARWPELAAASVTTHDLPTAAGFLAGEPLRVRAELGLLDRPLEAERWEAKRTVAPLLAALRAWGLLGPDATDADAVVAMHALLRRTPCRLVLAALADAVGDLRQPNLPGTTAQYPNWRLPIAVPGPAGPRPIGLEEIRAAPGVRRLAGTLGERPVPAWVPSAGDEPVRR